MHAKGQMQSSDVLKLVVQLKLVVPVLICFFCSCQLFAAETVWAAKRIALVIGNNDYDELQDLLKAKNDAAAVGNALSDLGFSVLSGSNLGRRDMYLLVDKLEASISHGDFVFFFYAGHGVSIGAENYLLPTDLPLIKEGEESLVEVDSLSADTVIRRFQQKGAETVFAVLDACRENPLQVTGQRSVGMKRGLSRIDAPKGVFVLYSAGIGQTALDRMTDDDPNPNSVFTRKLLPLLREPGLTQVTLAKKVQSDVAALAAKASHDQQPAYYDQIVGEIVLNSPEQANDRASASSEEIDRIKSYVTQVYLRPPNASDLQNHLTDRYATKVRYYGKSVARSSVIGDKLKWFKRWKSWQLDLVADSLVVQKLGDAEYSVTYEVDYLWIGKDGTKDGGKQLNGRARVELGLVGAADEILIISEDSERLSQ